MWSHSIWLGQIIFTFGGQRCRTLGWLDCHVWTSLPFNWIHVAITLTIIHQLCSLSFSLSFHLLVCLSWFSVCHSVRVFFCEQWNPTHACRVPYLIKAFLHDTFMFLSLAHCIFHSDTNTFFFNNVSDCLHLTFSQCFLPPALTWKMSVFFIVWACFTGTWRRCCPHTRWVWWVGKILQLDPTHWDYLFILGLSCSKGHFCKGRGERKKGGLVGGGKMNECSQSLRGPKQTACRGPWLALGSMSISQVPSVFNKGLG